MPLMLSEKLQTENALNGFRGVTDGGCPFWLQRSYRQRMFFLVAEKLQTVDIFGEDSLNLKMNQEECDFGISHFYVNTY
jgi:hypothetical protein